MRRRVIALVTVMGGVIAGCSTDKLESPALRRSEQLSGVPTQDTDLTLPGRRHTITVHGNEMFVDGKPRRTISEGDRRLLEKRGRRDTTFDALVRSARSHLNPKRIARLKALGLPRAPGQKGFQLLNSAITPPPTDGAESMHSAFREAVDESLDGTVCQSNPWWCIQLSFDVDTLTKQYESLQEQYRGDWGDFLADVENGLWDDALFAYFDEMAEYVSLDDLSSYFDDFVDEATIVGMNYLTTELNVDAGLYSAWGGFGSWECFQYDDPTSDGWCPPGYGEMY